MLRMLLPPSLSCRPWLSGKERADEKGWFAVERNKAALIMISGRFLPLTTYFVQATRSRTQLQLEKCFYSLRLSNILVTIGNCDLRGFSLAYPKLTKDEGNGRLTTNFT
jgi:hypothetical protein